MVYSIPRKHHRAVLVSFALWCNTSTDILESTWHVALIHSTEARRSAAECRAVGRPGIAEGNPLFLNLALHWRNTAAAAIINGLSTSQLRLPSLCPGPRWWRDCISSPPFPSDWTVPTPLQGSSGELDTVYCNDLHLCPLLHALMQASSAGALSWGHRYIKMTLWGPSFIRLLRFCCSPTGPLWSCERVVIMRMMT